MSTSAVTDVAIAMVLAFAVTALAASTIVEWIGNLTRKRAKYLLRGLRNMLDAGDNRTMPSTEGSRMRPAGVRAERSLYNQALTPTGQTVDALGTAEAGVEGGLTALVFDHPLLRSMMQPTQSAESKKSRVPPYVPAETFSRALIDTLVPGDAGPVTMAQVQTAIRELAGTMPAREALLSLEKQSRADLDAFRVEVERWYDAQMDRVSGWYKRWAQRWIIAVAAGLCLFANIDAYAIAGTLYRDPAVRGAIVGQAQQGQNCAALPDDQARADCVRDLVDAVGTTGRVVGWPAHCPATPSACVPVPGGGRPGVNDWLIKLLGLVVTTLAAAMGAPFWFGALNRLVNLRLTGKPPEPAG